MIAIALVLALTAQPADAVEEAKKYFDAGRQAYEAGDYSAAAAAFEEANKLSPRPAIVFSMAQAHRQQYFASRDPEHLRRAITLYTQYLTEVPKGGRRNDAVQHLADLQQQLAILTPPPRGTEEKPIALPESKTQLMVSSRTTNAVASIDASEPSEVPLIAEVEPGKHTIKVEAEGYETTEVGGTAVEGRLVVVEVNLKEKPGIIHVEAPEGADVMVDGRPFGSAPLLGPIEVSAGEHLLAITARGNHAFVRTLKLGRGESAKVEATLESTTQRDLSYYFLGAGGALFAATGVTVIVALVSEGQARLIQRKLETQMMNLTPEERDEYNSLRNRRSDMITASSLLLAGSVALGVTGGLLFFLDTPSVQARSAVPLVIGSGTSASSASLVPVISEDGAGAVFSASF